MAIQIAPASTPALATRSSGILLHVSSLPGRFGIGDLGPATRQWIDLLEAAGQQWWQVLPLGPSIGGDAPYGTLSAFAGNPLLVSPEDLMADGLLDKADLKPSKSREDRVDYERLVPAKFKLLDKAWTNFQGDAGQSLQTEFEQFCEQQADWLDDHALFMALHERHERKVWTDWPAELVRRKASAIKAARVEHAEAIRREQFFQFLFFRQWNAMRAYARARGIGVIGDAPIFVAFNSSDVWTNPEQFKLDSQRQPTVVAGVPPDYFSKTGQRWGNPIYNWKTMERDGFAWWVRRARATLKMVDLLRIDHFRGLAACWEIPAKNPTAEHGKWVNAPGKGLLAAFENAFDGLPFIAEDLGVITPDVVELRDQFNLPGMRVLQFAFGGDVNSSFLPHSYIQNTVVYTGTHDNDTALGLHRTMSKEDRKRLQQYLPGVTSQTVGFELVRAAWASVANLAVAPAQDVLNLPSSARMNTPGTTGINWRWRLREGQWNGKTSAILREITEVYGRVTASQQTEETE